MGHALVLEDFCLRYEMKIGNNGSLNMHTISSFYCDYSISQEICTRFLVCCALLWLYIDWFSHIHQAYFTGTVAI